MAHLFQRIDEGANAGYDTFRKNELTLDGRPLMAMSHLTSRLLESIDFGAVRIARNRNFTRLHDVLGDHNLLQLDSNLDCPLVYPFFSENPALRDRLIRSRVYVPIYWPNVLATSCVDSMEYKAAFGIVPLPIDQRYDISDMDRILEVIHGR
jgi:hypothetical protein